MGRERAVGNLWGVIEDWICVGLRDPGARKSDDDCKTGGSEAGGLGLVRLLLIFRGGVGIEELRDGRVRVAIYAHGGRSQYACAYVCVCKSAMAPPRTLCLWNMPSNRPSGVCMTVPIPGNLDYKGIHHNGSAFSV